MLLAAQGEWKGYVLQRSGDGVVDFTFRSVRTAVGDACIKLGFGNQSGIVWLDDVCISEADGGKLVFGPYTFDEGFEAFQRDWRIPNADKWSAACVFEAVPGDWKTGALKIVLAPGTGQRLPECVLQSHAGFTLRQGVFYRVSLRVRGDPRRRLSVDIGTHCGGTFHSLMENEPPFASQVKLAAHAGVNFLTTCTGMPWPKPGETFDWSTWADRATQSILDINPKAMVMPRFNLEPGYWWREANPDDVMAWEDRHKIRDPLIGIYGGQGSSMPDVASDKYRTEAGAHLVSYIRAMERKYGDKIAGYHLGGQVAGEWFYYGWLDKYQGYSIASRAAWRKWLKKKYNTDDPLAKAWNRAAAKIELAETPPPEVRRTPKLGVFYDPETQRDVIDFNEYQQDMMADTILHFAKIARRETRGRKLVVSFYGYSFEWGFLNLGPAQSGHYALRRILQSQDIDGLSAPIDYTDRQSGGGGPMKPPLESINLAGKVWFSEDDTCTHLSTGKTAGSHDRAKTLEESINLLRRNTVQAALRNNAVWWMDLRSRGWFADPGLWDEMRRLEKIDYRMLRKPVPFEPEIAALLDEYSMMTVGFEGDTLTRPLVYEGRASLGRVGAPYGQYLLDDFTAGRVRKAKLLVFLNAWNLDAGQRAAIRRHGAGKVRFWCHAAGLMDGRRASVENMAALTGFLYKRLPPPTDKVKKRIKATPAGVELGLAQEWESSPTDPLYAVTDARHEETLATWPDSSAAVVMRKGPDGVDIFCGVPQIPTTLYRASARMAGVHLYTAEEDCNVYANGPFVSLHASRDGDVSVRLPHGSEGFDAISDAKLGDGEALTLPMKKGETRVVRFAMGE